MKHYYTVCAYWEFVICPSSVMCGFRRRLLRPGMLYNMSAFLYKGRSQLRICVIYEITLWNFSDSIFLIKGKMIVGTSD